MNADSFYGHGAPLVVFTAAPPATDAVARFRLRRINGVMVRCDFETGEAL